MTPIHPEFDLRIARASEDVLKVMVVRGIVFIEEQQVDWEGEVDEFENDAIHILGEADGQPVASGRIRMLPDGRAKLERIAVRPRWRGRGYGRDVVQYMLDYAYQSGARSYVLHAQAHLQEFYEGFDFRREGDVFQECGIAHVAMVREDD
jgi:predicted GNAT family N-acyltransferase